MAYLFLSHLDILKDARTPAPVETGPVQHGRWSAAVVAVGGIVVAVIRSASASVGAPAIVVAPAPSRRINFFMVVHIWLLIAGRGQKIV